MKILLVIILFILINCSNNSNTSSGTEIGNGYVSAIVTDIDGVPVANAKVTLLSSNHLPSVLDSQLTDETGSFKFKSSLDTIVNILISKDEMSFFTDSISPVVDSIDRDTFTITKSGCLALFVDDSIKYADQRLYLSGTGLSVLSSEMVKAGEHWLINFTGIPEIEQGQIVIENNDTVKSFTGHFSIASGGSQNVLGGISWSQYSLPSIPLVSLAGWDDYLWWGGSTTILKIKNGTSINTYNADSFFNFTNLTATAMGVAGTFWLANDKGGLGYITSSGYYAMIPEASCTSSIKSVTPDWSIDEGNGIAKNGSVAENYFYTDTKFTQLKASNNGTHWAATDSGKIYHIVDSSSAVILTKDNGLPGDSVLDMAIDTDSSLWVITESTILKISDSNIVEVPVFQGVALTNVKFVEVNYKGVWFASDSTLYILLDNTVYPINWDGVSFGGSKINSIYSHLEGSCWLVTNSGLFQF